jgi:hypothetical protein
MLSSRNLSLADANPRHHVTRMFQEDGPMLSPCTLLSPMAISFGPTLLRRIVDDVSGVSRAVSRL